MEVYLDNAATTKVFPSVCAVMEDVMEFSYGNPASIHRMGMKAEACVKNTREYLAKSLKVEPKEIIFTSGGTEANNMALFGAARANKKSGMHIISTVFEHPSIREPLLSLKEEGFSIDFISVDAYGRIDLEELIGLIHEDTILVSVIYVNNEIGSVQDIAELAGRIKAKKKNILLHVDGVQAYGRYLIYPKREGIDLLSVSAHKLHGPKGIGFLYADSRVKLKPLLFGGGQQKGMRSGTENVPAIAGFGKAVKECFENFSEKKRVLYNRKQQLIDGLLGMEGVYLNGILKKAAESAPHIVNASFEGIRSEVLLHALEENGIYVSSGSACASNNRGDSHVLKAIGVSGELLDSAIRFSLSVYTTQEEIVYTLEKLKEIVPMLRRYQRK